MAHTCDLSTREVTHEDEELGKPQWVWGQAALQETPYQKQSKKPKQKETKGREELWVSGVLFYLHAKAGVWTWWESSQALMMQ